MQALKQYNFYLYMHSARRVFVMYYYTYVLLSKKDEKLYTGYTNNLRNRLEKHNSGLVDSTKNRRPLELIYFEGCAEQKDALRREKYLKSGNGKIYIRSRLRYFSAKIKNENPTG